MRIGDQPLDTIILEPKNRAPKYTIIWSNGICTTYKDYMLLLGPLSEEARIIAYNYRSHGGSKERFSPRGAVKELEGLVEDQDGPVFLGGHCTGAAISSSVKSDVQGRVLVCPYLGSDYLSTLPKAIMRLGRLLPICYMDRFIDYTGLVKCFGVENRKPIQDVISLWRFQPSLTGSSAMWMVSPNDEIIGTLYSKDLYMRLRQQLKSSYQNGVDKSRLVKGLTHSLNRFPGHLLPFLAACHPKRRQKIVDAILEYCESRV